jgi:SRSO17 transposase
MSEVVCGANYNQIQHFISESPWDANKLMELVASKVSKLFSKHATVYLIIDESSHLKKGNKSVGVARQYSGRVGKTDNCQVAVYGALSADTQYCLIDAKLYLPKDWTEDKERCKAAGIPDSKCAFKTKLELALDMVKEQKSRSIRFDWVLGDGFYGHGSRFRAGVDAMGIQYMLDIHSTDSFYLESPTLAVPKRNGVQGRTPTLLKADKHPMKACDYMEGLGEDDWKHYTLRDTAKGALVADIHVKEIFTWDEDTDKILKELLVIRRTKKEGEKKKEDLYEYKYSFSNVEYDKYSWLQLGQVQAQRYFVERGFQDAKKEIGMSEYQIRGWLAWHHHIALVMLGLLFVLQEKVEFKDDWPLLTASDIRQIIVEKYARNKNIYDTIKRRHKRRDDDIKRHKMKCDTIT